MKKLNVTISDEAKDKLLKYQHEENIGNLDEAVDRFIINGGK